MAFIPAYIFILFATITIDYFMAIKIARSTGRRRILFLQASILSTCLILFIFKYAGFFELTARELQGLLGVSQDFPITHIILPIGLSFHTFQSLSYVIEVYRGKQSPERDFGIYSLYVMFYPQLVAGPIERPQNLLHQFYENHALDVTNVSRGLCLMAWGLFQKVVVADRCAMYVNNVYGHWQEQSGLSLLVATLLFAVQIYADFAGYSSIAIGCARVMGFSLMTNFARPYFSSSFAEFWQRWHISLSTWFRDYIYIPLGGNRVSLSRHYMNLLITFAISGLWHGAKWTFVVWGTFNGGLLIIENYCSRLGWGWPSNIMGNILRRTVVLSCICVGWVFFRASDLHTAIAILRRIVTDTVLTRSSLEFAISGFALDITSVAVGVTTIIMIAIMFVIEGEFEASLAGGQRKALYSSEGFRSVATFALFSAVVFFGSLRSSAFVYFQF